MVGLCQGFRRDKWLVLQEALLPPLSVALLLVIPMVQLAGATLKSCVSEVAIAVVSAFAVVVVAGDAVCYVVTGQLWPSWSVSALPDVGL